MIHGETGLVVDIPDDPERVAEAIATLLDDEELRATMGQAARRRAELDFSYDVLADRLMYAIDRVVLG